MLGSDDLLVRIANIASKNHLTIKIVLILSMPWASVIKQTFKKGKVWKNLGKS